MYRNSYLALVLALCCFSSYSKAESTGNLVTDNSCSAWTVTPGTLCVQESWWGGLSGGNQLQINDNDGRMYFGYTNQTAARAWAINQALAQTGIQVDGFNYRWELKNADTESGQNRSQDPLIVTVNIVDINNTVVESYTYDYSYPLAGQWYEFSGTETFKTPYDITALNEAQFSVYGRDAGYWAGYYGPEFLLHEFSLNYSPLTSGAISYQSDPCSEIPVTDPTCPGFIGAGTTSVEEVVVEQPVVSDPIVEQTAASDPATTSATELVAIEATSIVKTEAAQPAATSEPAAVEVAEAAAVKETTSISTSRILSIVNNSTQGQDGNISPTSSITGVSVMPSVTSASSNTQNSQTNDSGNSQGGDSVAEAENIASNSSEASNDSEIKNEEQNQEEALGPSPDLNVNVPTLTAYNVVLPDVAFYVSKDIYKKHYVPDSKRGLRMGLANELKWNDMVDAQYNR